MASFSLRALLHFTFLIAQLLGSVPVTDLQTGQTTGVPVRTIPSSLEGMSEEIVEGLRLSASLGEIIDELQEMHADPEIFSPGLRLITRDRLQTRLRELTTAKKRLDESLALSTPLS
jgi:hypothetical protein